jgi:hypothetical protein
MADETDKHLVIRGRQIAQDENGNVCLDDLWEIARASSGKQPKFWRITEGAKALVGALAKKVGIPNLNAKKPNTSMIYASRGRGEKGTFAHPILAAAYAGYLDSKLEIEMREVWLRYRSGDATLADEILERASAEANHWAGVRALSRARRRTYTDTLKAHGVADKGYMQCTEAVYLHLLGGNSWQLRAKMGLAKRSNLRDSLGADKLAFIMAAEALASERIAEEGRQGNLDCAEASALSAAALRTAIESDRGNRQRRMIG